mmetsp:Transcript_43658/g.108028  ORF Transcript_43658/g.108028 Transcript_43658/m.108028 type:complete len:250 (-) Transcript_43658:858-1607(-)
MTTSTVSFLSSRMSSPNSSPRFCSACASNKAAARSSLSRCCRTPAISRACCSDEATRRVSPARGTPCKPSTSTGEPGSASSTSFPFNNNLRTRPHSAPATIISPTRKVPRWIIVVATAPRPRSIRASTATPSAGRLGFARRFNTSARIAIFSSRPSNPVPSFADTKALITSPPNFSRTMLCSRSSTPTLSGSAPSLSILFTATITGVPAAWAALMASTVCGLTPSSAATTKITMSVTLAPRARIAEKAA